jgi:hypothetical protein
MVETNTVAVKWLGALFVGTKQLLEKVVQNYKRIFAPLLPQVYEKWINFKSIYNINV